MQKSLTRLFTAVLMAALLVSASIISVSAATATQPCAGNHENDDTWIPISADTTFADGGQYYLADNWTTGITIPANVGTITLCLNGNKIVVEGGPAITVAAGTTLNLVNCVANDEAAEPTTGYIKATGTQYALQVTRASTTETISTVNMYDNVCISKCETTVVPVYVQRCNFNMNGGAISYNTTTECSGSTVSGGILLDTSGTVNLKGGSIHDNSATQTAYSGGNATYAGGGAVVKAGTMNIAGVSIYKNYAKAVSAYTGTTRYSYAGGGVCVQGNNSILNVTDGTIAGNWAESDAPASGTVHRIAAGGIYVHNELTANISGGVIGGDTEVIVEDGEPTNLGLNTGNYSPHSGGGIALRGTVNLSGNAVVKGNTGHFGGIEVYSAGTCTLNISENAVISNNTATYRGGGVSIRSGAVTMSGNAQIINNTAKQDGGGISANGTLTVTLDGGKIMNNQTTNDSNGGGGVCALGTTTITVNSNDVEITGNKSSSRPARNGIYVNGNSSLTIKGGKFDNTIEKASGSGTVTLSGGYFTKGSYPTGAGTVTVASGYKDTELDGYYEHIVLHDGHETAGVTWTPISGTKTISTAGKHYLYLEDDIELNYAGSIIDVNNAGASVVICMNGKTLKNTSTTDSHGCLRVWAGSVSLCNCSGEAGQLAAAGRIASVGGNNGTIGDSVLSIDSDNIEIKDCSLYYPITIKWDGVMHMNAGTIAGNTAKNYAAIDNQGGDMYLNGGTITGNTGPLGGAVYSRNPNNKPEKITLFVMNGGTIGGEYTKLDESKMTGNVSTHASNDAFGGGIHATSGQVILNGGTITGNTAKTSGGGVYLTETATLIMNDGEITSNKGGKRGGGVAVEADTTFDMFGGSITGNDGYEFGGGVSVRQGEFTMKNGTIANNYLSGPRQQGTQVVVGNNGDGLVGTFIMNGGTINCSNDYDTMVDSNEDNKTCYVSGDVVVGMGEATINDGTIDCHLGTVGFAGRDATLAINGGTFNGRVTNGEILRGTHTNTTPRGTCTVTITGGEFALMNDRDKLGEMLAKAYEGNTTNDKILSIKENGAEATYYVVAEGFYKTGEQLEWGSSLGLGVYLNAHVIPSNANISLKGFVSSDDIKVDDGKVEPAGNGIAGYKLVAHGIAAKDMDKAVTFLVTDSSGTVEYYNETHSIRELAEDWAKVDGMESMVVDMINYGIEAQKEFVPEQERMSALEGYSSSTGDVTWESEGIEVTGGQVGVSLNLKERIELNIYVPGANQKVDSATQDGENTTDYELTNVSGYTRITFGNINVTDVKDKIAVVTKDGYSVTCSIADYVVEAINDESQVALMKALQRYVESVSAYANKTNEQ